MKTRSLDSNLIRQSPINLNKVSKRIVNFYELGVL